LDNHPEIRFQLFRIPKAVVSVGSLTWVSLPDSPAQSLFSQFTIFTVAFSRSTFMNKLTKAALATGIGTALLVGGGSTLALWNDAADVGAAEDINTGVLTLDAGAGAWTANPELWVPGDSFSYTTDVSIVAQGDNLYSELSIDPTSITGAPALLAALETTMTVDGVQGGTLTPVGGEDNVFAVVPADATSGTPVTATITITVAFPADSVSDLVAQGADAHLADLQLRLNQVESV
jgi:alternate signal-mediated exported protein